MKNIFSILILLLGLTILIQSCKKDKTSDSIPQTTNQTINQTIKANQSFQFDLGYFGKEENASISKQATNYTVSTIDMDIINTGKVIYKYVPALNFVGTDKVEIKSARGSDGGSANDNVIYITINFIITN